MISEIQKNIIINTVRPYNPKRIGVFGSYVRGDQTEKSDLDILIDFYERVNLLDLIGIEQDLSLSIGLKVDLVTEHSLSDKLKPYILSEVNYFYK